jgi:hypothetical protein
MKVFIVKQEDELKIITVKPAQEAAFLEEYNGKIIVKGESIQEALIRFGELMSTEPGQKQ